MGFGDVSALLVLDRCREVAGAKTRFCLKSRHVLDIFGG